MKGKVGIVSLFLFAGILSAGAAQPDFNFQRDTFGFANMTVFEYKNGIAHVRRGADAKQKRYTRRCFVLSRTAMQFKKFARFEPGAPKLSDDQLAARLRQLTKIAAWKQPLPEKKRIVFPGYADVRELSRDRGLIVQQNVGLGWPTYWRPGNWRMIMDPGREYQVSTHRDLNRKIENGEFFVAFLTTLPWSLNINHAILVYRQLPGAAPGEDHYLAYDSNRPEGPRELVWSDRDNSFSYQKDWDFVGGNVRVYQVYGAPLQ